MADPDYDRVLEVDWRELFGPIRPIPHDQHVLVRVKREVVPIIFVPGLMGSRLKRLRPGPTPESQELGLAWEPEIEFEATSFTSYFTRGQYRGLRRAAWLARRFFRASAATRKSLIIGTAFDPRYLGVLGRDDKGGVDEGDREHAAASADVDGAYERGWVGVSMATYGPLLRELTGRKWSEPIRHCFDLPVHAYGYNWTESNARSGAKLATHVGKVIDEYRAAGRPCHRAILVTHSMGGLVARAASKVLGDRGVEVVLGVVHGAQPASGAPNAYWRMKGGFAELGISLMLGKNAAEVTALLGHMPGGLQLLPNKRYRVPGTEAPLWLTYPSPATGVEVRRPSTGNPYSEIYLERDQFYRLCDPSLLDPGGMIKDDTNLVGNPWQLYSFQIGVAERYHDVHQDYAHPQTYQAYATGLGTLSKVRYERTPDQWWRTAGRRTWHRLRPGWTPAPLRGAEEDAANTRNFRARVTPDGRVLDDVNAALIRAATGDQTALYDGDLYLMTLQHAEGTEGDGTVPTTSGRVLVLEDGRTVEIGEDEESSPGARGHEAFFKSRTAQHVTAMAIENLCLGLIAADAGRAAPSATGPAVPPAMPSNDDIRDDYKATNNSIPELNEQWKAEGVSAEERARRASEIRHDARLEGRRRMTDPSEVDDVQFRDVGKYGDQDGPAFDDLVRKYEARGYTGDDVYEEIIKGANRTDAETNRRYGSGRQ